METVGGFLEVDKWRLLVHIRQEKDNWWTFGRKGGAREFFLKPPTPKFSP